MLGGARFGCGGRPQQNPDHAVPGYEGTQECEHVCCHQHALILTDPTRAEDDESVRLMRPVQERCMFCGQAGYVDDRMTCNDCRDGYAGWIELDAPHSPTASGHACATY